MKQCVFVVDDDPSVRDSLRVVLEMSGYDVITADNGLDVERQLENPGIDLLVLDLNMPKRDGWAVLKETSSKHLLTPVIVITGLCNQSKTLGIPGVAAFLKKPIEPPVILQRIEELLSETPEMRFQRISRSC